MSGPEFDHGGPDRGSLPEQSTRIIDSGSPTPQNELPAQQTVLFNDQVSGQAKLPDAMPFNSAVGDPSMLYPPPVPSYTPHYGQLMPPGPGAGPARASVWKDILIGVVVAAVVVGGILGARKYLAARGQATLAIVSPSGGARRALARRGLARPARAGRAAHPQGARARASTPSSCTAAQPASSSNRSRSRPAMSASSACRSCRPAAKPAR